MKRDKKALAVMFAVMSLCAVGIAFVVLSICGKGKSELMLPLGAVCVVFANLVNILSQRRKRGGKDE